MRPLDAMRAVSTVTFAARKFRAQEILCDDTLRRTFGVEPASSGKLAQIERRSGK
jgi:hypothetical protein